jgi:hypothetical protein
MNKDNPLVLRNEKGQLQKGTVPINTHYGVARSNHIRNLLKQCTTDDEVKEVWSMVKDKAKQGEEWAVKEFLNRTAGRVETVIEGDPESLGPISIVYNRIEADQAAIVLPQKDSPMSLPPTETPSTTTEVNDPSASQPIPETR